MNKFIASIFSLTLLLSATLIHAETRQYNIEIVIFEDTSDRYLNSEQWPVIHHPEQILSSEAPKSDADIFTNAELEIETKITPAEYPENNNVVNVTYNTSNTLAEQVEKLNRSSRYNVLLHQSWQQTGLSNNDAINIKVDTTTENNTENKDVSIFNSNNQISKIDNEEIKSNLKGTLKLILGRYLHIHTDLLYQRPKKTYSSSSPMLHGSIFNEFKIKSQRRMRSKELHYIDHPLLGILILINPVTPQENLKINN